MSCQDNKPPCPEVYWRALKHLPAFRYMKAPVFNVSELYESYPDGAEYGTVAYVINANLFYTWDFATKKWKPIAGGEGGSSHDCERFTEDITVQIKSGKSFGKYLNGDIVPAKGKTAVEVIIDALNEKTDPPGPEEGNIMYYGNTATYPQVFQNMTIQEIFGLEGITSKTITGTGNNTFVIHQTDRIHFLLVPEDKVDLIKAEYGTVLITTLWDNNQNTGAYFTVNPGGVYDNVKYKVFFFYSPMGAFSEDIRITCKNK